MSKSDTPSTGLVRKETLYTVATLCVAAGFLAGVLFSIYKLDRRQVQSTPPVMGGGSPANPPAISQAVDGEINAAKAAAEAQPGNANLWAQLGHKYFDSNRPNEAIAAYQKSLEIDPNKADIWTDMGVMHRRARQFPKAIESFDRAIAIESGHEIAHFNKGIVLLHDLGKNDEALAVWENLLSINPLAMAPNGMSVDQLVQAMKQQAKTQ